MFIFSVVVLLQIHATWEHVTFPISDYCLMASTCVHDRRPSCGTAEDGCTRTFIDVCDMYEYNCDHKTVFTQSQCCPQPGSGVRPNNDEYANQVDDVDPAATVAANCNCGQDEQLEHQKDEIHTYQEEDVEHHHIQITKKLVHAESCEAYEPPQITEIVKNEIVDEHQLMADHQHVSFQRVKSAGDHLVNLYRRWVEAHEGKDAPTSEITTVSTTEKSSTATIYYDSVEESESNETETMTTEATTTTKGTTTTSTTTTTPTTTTTLPTTTSSATTTTPAATTTQTTMITTTTPVTTTSPVATTPATTTTQTTIKIQVTTTTQAIKTTQVTTKTPAATTTPVTTTKPVTTTTPVTTPVTTTTPAITTRTPATTTTTPSTIIFKATMTTESPTTIKLTTAVVEEPEHKTDSNEGINVNTECYPFCNKPLTWYTTMATPTTVINYDMDAPNPIFYTTSSLSAAKEIKIDKEPALTYPTSERTSQPTTYMPATKTINTGTPSTESVKHNEIDECYPSCNRPTTWFTTEQNTPLYEVKPADEVSVETPNDILTTRSTTEWSTQPFHPRWLTETPTTRWITTTLLTKILSTFTVTTTEYATITSRETTPIATTTVRTTTPITTTTVRTTTPELTTKQATWTTARPWSTSDFPPKKLSKYQPGKQIEKNELHQELFSRSGCCHRPNSWFTTRRTKRRTLPARRHH